MTELSDAYRRGVRWSMLGSLGTGLLQFVQMAVFARLAGPEAGGDYALAAIFMAFLSPLAEAGLSQAVVQAERVRAPELALLVWINWLLGVLIFIVLWMAGTVVSEWFHRPELPDLLLLMSASLLIKPFGAQYAGLLSRELDFGNHTRIELLSWGAALLSTVWPAYMGWGSKAMAVGFLVRNCIATLGYGWVGKRIIRINPFHISPLRATVPLLRFGAYELAARWVDFFSNYLDKLIVAAMLGATALGYYNLALTFLMLPTARLAYVVSRVTFPLIAKVQGDTGQIQQIFEHSSREIILLLYPVYLAIALFAHEITLLGFGEAWLPAAPLFTAFGLAGLVRTLSSPFPQLLKGIGKPQLWFMWSLLFSAALFAGQWLSILWFPSIETAAWSRTVVKCIVEIPLLFMLARWSGLQFRPTLLFACKALAYLIPAVFACVWAGFWQADFYVLVFIKSAIYILLIILIYFYSPLKKPAKELLRIFYRPK